MNIVTWNVAGLRGFLKKYNLAKFLKEKDIDILCFNETKVRVALEIPGVNERYNIYWCHCRAPLRAKYGYSGVAILVKKEIHVTSFQEEIGKDNEGRVITLEFNDFYLVATYVPNSGRKLDRLDYRVGEWDDLLRKYLCDLRTKKDVLWMGDLNVIRFGEDVHATMRNRRFAGNTEEERASFEKTLEEAGLTEVRDVDSSYTYWSYFNDALSTNRGMRLDYVCATPNICRRIKSVTTLKGEILSPTGAKRSSDHAPLLVVLNHDDVGKFAATP